MTVNVKTWKIEADAYLQMMEAGIIRASDRVELFDGKIVEMSPIGNSHAGMVDRIANVLMLYIKGRAIIRVQNPVRLSELSMPQPDVAILHQNDNYYSDTTPGPADIHLLIEVADSSLDYDQDFKLHHYAEAGIREYWIVDLPQHRLLRYYEASGQEYRHREIIQVHQSVTLRDFDLEIPALELLGPTPE
ncbi:MAG: Uma2 family endonuclease [Bacteroidota bacterium]